MKRLLWLILVSVLFCSQICFAAEKTVTYYLKDGSEVCGEDLGGSNGVYRVRTDSGVVEVKSSEVAETEYKFSYSWEDLGIDKDDMKKALEEINDRFENYSDNQDYHYEEEYNDSNTYNDRYEEYSNDSDSQNDSYEEDSSDSDYQNDSYEEES